MSSETTGIQDARPEDNRLWLGARYHAFYFQYRDPGSVSSRSLGSIAPSPTTVVGALASTLFAMGEYENGREVMKRGTEFEVKVDTPESAVFFRAMGLMRRYQNVEKAVKQPRGLTQESPDVKEHGLVGGTFGIYVGCPPEMRSAVYSGLDNMSCLGSRDSMLSPEGHPFVLEESPEDVLYTPRDEIANKLHDEGLDSIPASITTAVVSRFCVKPEGIGNGDEEPHWWISGGEDTELISYAIPGRYIGTNRGKVYLKRD